MSQKAVVRTSEISVGQIKPSPYQPRLTFDLEDIRGSIQRDGILVPLTVRKKAGYYELIDGERRLRLAKLLGYKTVPCDVVNIDDDTARRMVWKVNTLRKDYESKEKAVFFKTMQEKYGMSLRGIAQEYDTAPHAILAYLNVFKLPEEYQQMVWDSVIPIRNIQAIETLFSEGVTRVTRKDNAELFEMLDRSAKEKHFGAEQIQEALKPYLGKLREEQVEKAKEALAEVKPEVEAPRTPEEFEEAAKALKEEAKRRKTPKQIREEKSRKARKIIDSMIGRMDNIRDLISVDKYLKTLKKLEAIVKSEPDKALLELKTLNSQLQTDIKKVKEEKERKQLEEEARQKVEQELLTDEKFLKKAAELAPPVSVELEEQVPIKFEGMKPAELQEVRERWERLQDEIKETLARPEVKERGELFMNWLAHGAFIKSLGSARCPVCGENWKNLVWKCHDLNLEEAYKIASERYQESMKKK
jgi:ParB/RepB/Spo0J family partition protein